jgi:phosphoribosylglycinamide formyltransferase-1
MPHRPKIAILASGSGSTTESIIHATQNGVLHADVCLVVSNNETAVVFERVKRMNTQYNLNIQTIHINGVTHPEGIGLKGEQTLSESAAITAATKNANVDLILLLGYMKKVRGDLLQEYGGLPHHTSIYQARMINTHPGPLPESAAQFGRGVQQIILDTNLGYSAQTLHVVTDEYDMGQTVAVHRVPVLSSDTSDTLFDSVQLTEKAYLPVDVEIFLNEQASFQS